MPVFTVISSGLTAKPPNPGTGGGAGGGIFVRCRSISGNGQMNAAAGPQVGTDYYGGGGGGRIAIWYGDTEIDIPPLHRMVVHEEVRPDGFPYTGITDVSADADSPANRRGQDGTVRFVRVLQPHGTFLQLR